MKLDPSLIRDVLQADPEGETPATPQQWLGLANGTTPSVSQIQAAYQRQVQRLKQARDRFDSQQLKLAAQSVKEAALALRPNKPAATEVPADKPVAQPLMSSTPSESTPEIAIRTSGPARRKKSQAGLWVGILFVLVVLSGGAVFWLQQTGNLDLAQVMGQAESEEPVPAPPPSPDATDPRDADEPQPVEPQTLAPDVVDDDVTDSDMNPGTPPAQPPVQPDVVPDPDSPAAPPKVEKSDSIDLSDLKTILADGEGRQLEELAIQFDRCLAAIFQRDDAAIQSHLNRMKSLDSSGTLFNLLEKTRQGYADFDRMFLERLPLIEQRGEIESGKTIVGIRSLKPNQYAFRIAGENRTFSDKDLPLGLKLAMFAAVIPEYPADDVYLHVMQCLPYLRSQPELKDSLAERLASTQTMEPGNLFDSSLRPVLAGLVGADGSLGLWFYELAPNQLPAWRSDRNSQAAGPRSTSESGHLEAYLSSLSAGVVAPSLRLGMINNCLADGELTLAIGLMREHWLWETPSSDPGQQWFATLRKHPQAAELAPGWLNMIEVQLADSHNVPELDEFLSDLGTRLARAYDRRGLREWTQRYQKAVAAKGR